MRICLVPALDKSPACIKYAQTFWGKALLLGAFACVLFFHGKDWWLDVVVMLAVTSYLPSLRTYLLPLGSLYWLCTYLNLEWNFVTQYASSQGQTALVESAWFKAAIVASIILFCWTYSNLSHRYPKSLLFKRPLFTLFIFYFFVLWAVSYLPLSAVTKVIVWALIIILSRYFWYLAYSLAESRNKTPKPFLLQFGHYFGFWSGGLLDEAPIPKGAAYIRKIEAKNSTELAICQLKGFKLLLWALYLKILTQFCVIVFHDQPLKILGMLEIPYRLVVPRFAEIFTQYVQGTPLPWHICWVAIIIEKLTILLKLSVYGHLIVALCRMVGFNALRNTYRPLEVKTILDYWNHFFFYFKELLVDLFFYPAFFRYFKSYPKLRLFFATFCAAGIGNLLSHLVLDVHVLYQYGFIEGLLGFANYLPYAILLSTGIWLSQLRQQKSNEPSKAGFFRREILSRVGVWAFIFLLHPIDYWWPDRKLVDSFKVLVYLFGINLND